MTSAIEPDDLHVAEVEMYEVPGRGAVAAAATVPAASGEPGRRRAGRVDRPRALPGPRPRGCAIRSPPSGARARRSSRAGPRAGELDDDEARTLAVVLAWAVEIETTAARPALLSALQALGERDRVPPWALDRVLAHLAGTPLDGPEEGFRAGLAAALAAHRRRAGADQRIGVNSSSNTSGAVAGLTGGSTM